VYNLSISDIRTFRRCRRRWFYGSTLGYGRAPAEGEKNKYLRAGSMVHEALAAEFGGNGPGGAEAVADVYLQSASEDEREEFEKALAGLRYYLHWAKSNMLVKYAFTERQVQIPLTADANFCCTLDAVAQDHEGLWLLEYKSCSRFPDSSALSLDEQGLAYVWAFMQETKIRLVGTKYIFIRKQAPEPPKVLRSGELSRAKSTLAGTTYTLYRQAIEENALRTEDYTDVLDQLQSMPDPTVRVVPIRYTNACLKAFEKELKEVANEIMSNPVIYPNPTWHECPYCPYYTACELEHNGLDPEPLLMYDFAPTKERYK